jgi:hypothetical protein
MHLEGSCLCGVVRFSLDAYAPVPYLHCYCSICRKSAGAGGFAVNLGGWTASLSIKGEDNITVFHATIDGERSTTERRFCSLCGTALWTWDGRWPELIHPFAGAIDTPLPKAPAQTHMMLDSKPTWVRIDDVIGDSRHDLYPSESLEDWHRQHGYLED